MKPSKFLRIFLALSVGLALGSAFGWLVDNAHAELVREQQIQEDAISPEVPSTATELSSPGKEASQDEEVVIVKKKAPKRRVVVQEVEDANTIPTILPATAVAPAATPADKAQSIGNSIDTSIDTKMNTVKKQFEEKVVKMLDRIKITVDEDQPQQQVVAQAQPVPQTTVVKDAVVNTSAAPEVEAAPETSKAREETEERKNRISVFPLVGLSYLNSSSYNVDPRYTAGFGLEVELSNQVSFVTSYTYSQYSVRLGTSNPYYTGYYAYTPAYSSGNNLNSLSYNQNLVDAGLRFYLMPQSSRLRLYFGTGIGYSKGYLNYNPTTLATYASNQYLVSSGQLSDYEVNSFVGQIEAGADIQLSKSVSIGAGFKYNAVLSSSQNDPINNNAFVSNAYGMAAPNDKSVAGGSISQDSFYSILANLKFSF